MQLLSEGCGAIGGLNEACWEDRSTVESDQCVSLLGIVGKGLVAVHCYRSILRGTGHDICDGIATHCMLLHAHTATCKWYTHHEAEPRLQQEELQQQVPARAGLFGFGEGCELA